MRFLPQWKHLQSWVIPINIFLLCSGSLAWDPDMPGGMKLVIGGDTYSFTSDICSGGIFFKQPVHVELTCLHGYFLKRPNGCSMEGGSIIGGQNYVCQRVNKDKTNLVQALVPVTNPERPLDHTITFFDDPDTLQNLRRYTYVKGLEGGYEGIGSDPVGVIVTNTQKTPKINIGNVCYQGKTQHSGSSYMARLATAVNRDSSSEIFTPGCDAQAVPFPWGKESVYNFSEGYSAPNLFDNEIKAKLSTSKHGVDHIPESQKHEIWGGLAYCLQAETKVSPTGSIKMNGIEPSIESLQFFCPKSNAVAMVPAPVRKSRSLVRKARDVETSIEFNTLMTCVSTCWKNNPDKCHQKSPQINTMPFCPPYCGGMKKEHHEDTEGDTASSIRRMFGRKLGKREAIFAAPASRFRRRDRSSVRRPSYSYAPAPPVVMKMF
jgi:hypothetical protein